MRERGVENDAVWSMFGLLGFVLAAVFLFEGGGGREGGRVRLAVMYGWGQEGGVRVVSDEMWMWKCVHSSSAAISVGGTVGGGERWFVMWGFGG